jgi:hypothetical protein
VLVILAASSEATCPANNCNFTFATPISTVASLIHSFNAVSNALEITISGSGFPAGNT